MQIKEFKGYLVKRKFQVSYYWLGMCNRTFKTCIHVWNGGGRHLERNFNKETIVFSKFYTFFSVFRFGTEFYGLPFQIFLHGWIEE